MARVKIATEAQERPSVDIDIARLRDVDAQENTRKAEGMCRVARKRNARGIEKTSVEDQIAHLRALDLKGLRARWRGAFQRLAPDPVPRHLLIAILAYQMQADAFGDLDHETKKVLDRTAPNEARADMSARLAKSDRNLVKLTPGTMLTREWDHKSHRVMVLADGFAWNGKTYNSLSTIAFAITGTKWNGPRFFGLRDKSTSEATS